MPLAHVQRRKRARLVIHGWMDVVVTQRLDRSKVLSEDETVSATLAA